MKKIRNGLLKLKKTALNYNGLELSFSFWISLSKLLILSCVNLDDFFWQSFNWQYKNKNLRTIKSVSWFQMERTRGIGPPQQPWQGCILPLNYVRIKVEGLVGFEPTIRELQSHALPLGYRPIYFIICLFLFFEYISILS